MAWRAVSSDSLFKNELTYLRSGDREKFLTHYYISHMASMSMVRPGTKVGTGNSDQVSGVIDRKTIIGAIVTACKDLQEQREFHTYVFQHEI